MSANLTALPEVPAEEQQAIEGGAKFNIQDLLSRYFQSESLAPEATTTLVHEPTHQRG